MADASSEVPQVERYGSFVRPSLATHMTDPKGRSLGDAKHVARFAPADGVPQRGFRVVPEQLVDQRVRRLVAYAHIVLDLACPRPVLLHDRRRQQV
jgi:hypothetical protein